MRRTALAAALAALLAGALTRYLFPRVEVRESAEVQEVAKVEERVSERRVEDPVRTVTVVREVPVPNPADPAGPPLGVERTTTVTEDRGAVTVDSRRDAAGESASSAKLDRLSRPAGPDWLVGLSAHARPAEPLGGIDWGAHVHRRVLGPVWLGVQASTDGRVAASLSVTF